MKILDQIQQTDQNSRLRLGGDLAIITRDDGIVFYTLIGGVQYTLVSEKFVH